MGLFVSSSFISNINSSSIGQINKIITPQKTSVPIDFMRTKFNPKSYININTKASTIKTASIITTKNQDILLGKTKNGGYIIEKDTNTELIYGNEAINYLKNKTKFNSDTQITFPKQTSGTLYIDNQEIEIKENSSLLLNAGTEAKVVIKNGYPQILKTEKDFPWYKPHGLTQKDTELKNKFSNLTFLNSHTYNGEFKSLTDNLDKNNQILDKLKKSGIIKETRNNYLKFDNYYEWNYLKKLLPKAGLTRDEIKAIEPTYKQIRQTKIDTKLTLHSKAENLPAEIIQTLKDKNILYNNKTHTDEIFWKTNYESEQHLRDALSSAEIDGKEQNTIVNAWKSDNKIGYDITGLKFINDNVAIYCLDDKINNMSMEKSCWVTNSTTLAANNHTPAVGTSMVQITAKKPTQMSKLRRGETLHFHPKINGKSQTEMYLITSGSAALTVVKDGIPKIRILKQGELAIIPPNTPHCINSVMGEYEQIVSQVPSAFHYGPMFKQNYAIPEGFSEKNLNAKAKEELLRANKLS